MKALWCAAFATLVVSACGAESATITPAATFAIASFTDCPGGAGGEHFGNDWTQVASSATVRRFEIAAIESETGESMRVSVTEHGKSSGPRVTEIGLSDPAKAAVRWGLATHARLTVLSNRVSSTPPFLAGSFLIVIPRDSEAFFAGECATRDINDPMRTLLGPDFGRQVAALADEPITLPDASPASSVTYLSPGDAPPELLDSLSHITIQFALPRQWADAELGESYVLATEVEAGWNDALPLTWKDPDPMSTRIGAYLPPKGRLTVWILGGDGDPAAEVWRLADLDCAELLDLASRGTKADTDVVVVTVASDASAAEVVAGRGAVTARAAAAT